MGVEKYPLFTRTETQVGGDTTVQNSLAQWIALEDETIAFILAEVAISIEPPSILSGRAQIAGFVRLVIHGGGKDTPPIVQPQSAWHATGLPDTGFVNASIMDADTGETWAISPYAVAASDTGGTGHMVVTLAPKTKRKLRRGDVLHLEISISNSASANAVVALAATGVIMTID